MFYADSRSSSYIHISIPYGTVSWFTSSPYIHPSVRALAPSKAPPSSIVTGAWRKRFFWWWCVWKNSDFQIPQISCLKLMKSRETKIYFRAPNFVKTHAAVIHNSTTNSPSPWHWRHLHALFQTLKISLARWCATPQGLAWMISDGSLLEMLDAMSPRFRNKFNGIHNPCILRWVYRDPFFHALYLITAYTPWKIFPLPQKGFQTRCEFQGG